MKTIEKLLTDLQRKKIQLWLDNSTLRYTAPKGALTDDLRSTLRVHKEEIKLFLQEIQHDLAEIAPPLLPVGRAQPLPLSFAQQRLWFLDQLEPNSAFYNIRTVLRLSGQLDVVAFEQSVRYLLERHESLRTVFVSQTDGTVRQVIQPPASFTLPVIPVAGATEAQQRTQTETTTPFDLCNGPLLRVQLLRLAETDHWLVLTMHHISGDGWSLAVLINELSHVYRAYTSGTTPTLPTLPIQYADFAVWQREYLSGERLARQLTYWREQLADAPALLELPTDRPRPAVQSNRGAHHEFQLDAALTAQLDQLAQAHNATLFMLLLTAFNVLLAHYSRQEDILVGTPIANRNRTEIEGLIGCFVNTLVLRTRLEGNLTFSDVLAQVRQTTLDAYQHQELPFEHLVEELNVTRTLSYSPLFQVMLVLQNANSGQVTLPGLTTTVQPVDFPFAKFDLTLNLMEHAGGLLGAFEYATDLFDEATIARLTSHFTVLLQGIVANPEQPIQHLPLLTATEYHQIVHEWNDTAVDFGTPQTIHALFEQQVARTPEAVAVVSPKSQVPTPLTSDTLTYAELNARANQLAHHLIALGVEPDTLVAVAMERSIEMVVSLLAVLKAGGAYVPIDPTYPSERIRYMLSDSAAPILLTQSHRSTKDFGELSRVAYERLTLAQEAVQTIKHVITVDEIGAQLAGQPTDNPQTPTAPTNLAYVIYTSGSTGQPKGVMIPHVNVWRLFAATEAWYGFTTDDVWTLFHSFAFDFSVWELWGALGYGGRLVIVPYLVSRDPQAFYELLCEQGITVLNQTPSAFRQLISVATQSSRPHALRYVIFGGEALEFESLRSWFAHYGDAKPQLVNMYGITETTVHVTYQPIQTADLDRQRGSSRIGQAIPDLRLYILDTYGLPVSIGVAAELYVGGAGLARGYLNRPDLTTERFIEHPEFGRLYKTGDLCRWLPDGNIEYIGRSDFQVKIRGFRIELSEIENALLAQPGVREAVVLTREDSPGDKRLVAYVVGEAEPETLRQALAQRLPDYMAPAAFVQLETLPLTPNGKLDRKALPAPNYTDAQAFFEAPRTEQEAQLAAIWGDVLKLERVGVNDNFFALGGDSILSIQVIAKAQQVGIQLSLQELFQHQTIAALARQCAPDQDLLPPSIVFGLLSEADRQQIPDDTEDAYPLAALQAGMVFHSELNPESAVYHDIFSYQLQAPFVENALRQAVQALAARHPTLRTRFALTGYSEPLQLVQRSVIVPLAVVDLRDLATSAQEEHLHAWIEAEKQRPFAWQQAPLFRVQIHRRSDEQFNLTLSFHHAIVDGWSIASLMTELLQRYFAYLGYAFAQPAPLLASYHQFVALERGILADDSCRHYWQTSLQDGFVSKLPRWPQTAPRPAHAGGDRRSRSLPPELSDGLHQLARQAGVPLKSVLLAAHLNVLRVLSNQTDIMTGLVSNGRPETADGERILGLFLNTLPFRLALSGGSWLELVQQVFAHEQHLLPFRRYPLAAIQKMQGGATLFETAFNFINFHVYEGLADIAGLTMVGGQFFEQDNFVLAANFHLHQRSRQIRLDLSYDPQEFCAAQIETILGYYETSLTAMSSDSTANYRAISLLSACEHHQIVHEWNATTVDFGEPQTIHALFEQQVERTPDADAVVFAGDQERETGEQRAAHARSPIASLQSLTYAELNARANQLAHHLIELGVKSDTLVAVAMERSIEMVVSLLAVLKAGGAYVPVDPTYPAAHIRYLLTDSAASILLTQSHFALAQWTVDAAQNRVAHPRHVLAVDTMATLLAGQPSHNPQTQTAVANLAYVIYTSGSTGQPKGVLVEHGALSTHIRTAIHHYQVDATDCVLQFASLSFDVSLEQIFVAWCSGAKLLLRGKKLWTLEEFDHQLIKHGITVSDLPPAYCDQLIHHWLVKSASLLSSSLRLLIVGGDRISPAMLNGWQQLPEHKIQLVNAYGPTETTITATCFDLGKAQLASGPVAIGQPLPNRTAYILDLSMQPTPLGITGELYLGGAGLARGYLNRPDLTGERFIEHPEFGRLYKTGDLCRWLSDGNIEFLGRTDFQVKIRGFRVELGEIENALLSQPGVREAVVLAREDMPDDKRLVAYVVGEVEQEPLRQALAQHLPDYMVPTACVLLDAMPLTPNGKLDRRALPAPDYTAAQSAFVAPHTETETVVAQAFATILRLSQVGVHDHFFRLGGDSILSIQVVSHLAQQGYRVTVKELFQHPTIAELATVIQPTDLAPTLAAQTMEQGVAPLLPIQRWLLESNQPAMHHYNQAVLCSIKQAIDLTHLKTAIHTLLCHHDALRFQYQQTAIGWQQRYLERSAEPSASVPLEVVDLSAVAPAFHAAEIERIGAQHQASLNPLQGDLMRWVYFQRGSAPAEADRLLIVIHHLAVDGVSWRILLEDLTTLLAGSALPPKTSSYRAWVETLQTATQQGQFDRDIQDWLEDAPATTLPLDEPLASNTIAHTHHLSLTLSSEQTTHLLRTLPDRHGVTLDAVLLTALSETLAPWSGQSGVRVQFESHGRQELFPTIDLTRTVGWFTSVYPLTIPRFQGSAVKRIRYTLDCLRRAPEGGISFGALHDFHPDETVRRQLHQRANAPIVYNYLGQLDTFDSPWFALAPESAGATIAPTFQRDTLLDSNAWINGGQLTIGWTVTPQLHRQTAEMLLNAFRLQLEQLIAEALLSQEQIPIRSDFPDIDLSLDEFETLMKISTTNQELPFFEPLEREVGAL